MHNNDAVILHSPFPLALYNSFFLTVKTNMDNFHKSFSFYL